MSYKSELNNLRYCVITVHDTNEDPGSENWTIYGSTQAADMVGRIREMYEQVAADDSMGTPYRYSDYAIAKNYITYRKSSNKAGMRRKAGL